MKIIDKNKLRYAIVKEIDKGNKKITEVDFGVSVVQFDDAVRYLTREGYLGGIFYADDRPLFFEGTAYLTVNGEDYLRNNALTGKIINKAKGIKEFTDLFKF